MSIKSTRMHRHRVMSPERSSPRLRGVAFVGAVAFLTVAAATPALAADLDDSSSAIDVIESISPESLEVVSTASGVVAVDETAAEEDEFGRSVFENPLIDETDPDSLIQVEIPDDPSVGITFSQTGVDDIVIGLPNANHADDADYGDLDLATYDNNDGSTTVPIPQPDGTLQITTVIDGPDAPVRYVYPITLPEGGSLVDAGDGFFAILDGQDLPAALIEPAWARDANGAAVDTHYEISGNALVQVVEHQLGDSYPIVADPAVKGRYISKVTTSRNSSGYVVGVYPVNSWAFVGADNYYAEYKLWVISAYEGQKYYDQLKCHYDFAPFKVPWNLDSWRPNVGYPATVAAGCNP